MAENPADQPVEANEGPQALIQEEQESNAVAKAQEVEEKRIPFELLTDDLMPMAASWRAFGTMLGMSRHLNDIEGERNRCKNCLLSIIQKWFEMDTEHTKAKVVAALRTKAVGEQKLAVDIEKNEDIRADLEIDDDDDADVIEILFDALSSVAHKYTALGIQLSVSFGTIREEEARVKNVRSYLHDLLDLWYKKDKPLSKVIKALKSKAVGNSKLAMDLEKKWIKDDYMTEEPSSIR